MHALSPPFLLCSHALLKRFFQDLLRLRHQGLFDVIHVFKTDLLNDPFEFWKEEEITRD